MGKGFDFFDWQLWLCCRRRTKNKACLHQRLWWLTETLVAAPFIKNSDFNRVLQISSLQILPFEVYFSIPRALSLHHPSSFKHSFLHFIKEGTAVGSGVFFNGSAICHVEQLHTVHSQQGSPLPALVEYPPLCSNQFCTVCGKLYPGTHETKTWKSEQIINQCLDVFLFVQLWR